MLRILALFLLRRWQKSCIILQLAKNIRNRAFHLENLLKIQENGLPIGNAVAPLFAFFVANEFREFFGQKKLDIKKIKWNLDYLKKM